MLLSNYRSVKNLKAPLLWIDVSLGKEQLICRSKCQNRCAMKLRWKNISRKSFPRKKKLNTQEKILRQLLSHVDDINWLLKCCSCGCGLRSFTRLLLAWMTVEIDFWMFFITFFRRKINKHRQIFWFVMVDLLTLRSFCIECSEECENEQSEKRRSAILKIWRHKNCFSFFSICLFLFFLSFFQRMDFFLNLTPS